MKEIRQAFHDIQGNLNRISMKFGIVREMAKVKDIDSMDEQELKAEFKKTLEIVSSTEKTAVEAGKSISQLRKRVYGLLKIDASKPLG